MFIVFEGPEGSGKSTQILKLQAHIESSYPTLVTKEPGGTAIGDAIRELVLSPNYEVDALTEFLLYSASRAQHVKQVIQPALEQGAVVLCDRFYGSSIAYQGYGRGLELTFLKHVSEHVTYRLEPDITLLLDIAPEEGLARVAARGAKDRLERADLAFHKRVQQGFLAQAQSNKTWFVIDASQNIDAISEEIWSIVQTKLNS